MAKSRRVKMVYVGYEDLLGIMNGPSTKSKYVRVPRIPSLPHGYRVVAVWPSIERNAVGFVIEHESFDEVEAGCFAPEFYVEHLVAERIATAQLVA